MKKKENIALPSAIPTYLIGPFSNKFDKFDSDLKFQKMLNVRKTGEKMYIAIAFPIFWKRSRNFETISSNLSINMEHKIWAYKLKNILANMQFLKFIKQSFGGIVAYVFEV